MQAMFQVCQRGRELRWTVTLGNAIYGAYLDKEQALLDAVDAARDSLQAGCEAQVWIRDGSTEHWPDFDEPELHPEWVKLL
jgi:hypothetical protein